MRDIKFRAWDKLTNKMIVTGFHIFGEVTMFNLLSTYIYENPGDESYGSGLEMELKRQGDIEIMQYTGLKDKNGVEIYEGDICEVNYYDLGLVKGSVVFRVIYSGYYLESEKFQESMFAWEPKFIEIVGNIYEHPHLLTPNNSHK